MSDRPIITWDELPESQRVSMTIVPEPGQMIAAETVGAQIKAFARLMRTLPNAHTDLDWMAFIGKLSMNENGAIEVGLVVAPRGSKLPPPPEPT